MDEIRNKQVGTKTATLTLVSFQTTATYYVKVFAANGSFTWGGPYKVTVDFGCTAPGARLAAVEVPLSVMLTPNPLVDGQLRAIIIGAGQSAPVGTVARFAWPGGARATVARSPKRSRLLTGM